MLSGPYNVPYFSTFLVPAEHFSRGGLHEAAIPYERKLRSDGIVDDDGVHYLNPLQGKELADELNGAIHEVLDPPTPQVRSDEEIDRRPLNADEDKELSKSLYDAEAYAFLPNFGKKASAKGNEISKALTPSQALELSGELTAGMKYAYEAAAPTKPPAPQGLTMPQTQNLHKYLAEGLKEVYDLETPPRPRLAQLPALKYHGGSEFWKQMRPKPQARRLPALKYGGGAEFWERLHPSESKQAEKLPALKYEGYGPGFWKMSHPAAAAKTAPKAAPAAQHESAQAKLPALKYKGGAGFWKFGHPGMRTAPAIQLHQRLLTAERRAEQRAAAQERFASELGQTLNQYEHSEGPYVQRYIRRVTHQPRRAASRAPLVRRASSQQALGEYLAPVGRAAPGQAPALAFAV